MGVVFGFLTLFAMVVVALVCPAYEGGLPAAFVTTL
jgi:hypothetical protein